MNGKRIVYSPSVKMSMLAISGKYDKNYDGKYVYFERTSVIIAPVKCKMSKCYFHDPVSV